VLITIYQLPAPRAPLRCTMASWFTGAGNSSGGGNGNGSFWTEPGGGGSGLDQLRGAFSRASSSVQRLAEQAELQNLGDKVFASAQALAEQGEAVLRDARETVAAGGASALTLLQAVEPTEASYSVEEFARAFTEEARALKTKHSSKAPSGSSYTHVVNTFRLWEERLNHRGDDGVRALRALHRSRALIAALEALASSKTGLRVIRVAATGPGPSSAGQDAGRSNDDKCEAARLLCALLERTSRAGNILIRQLLRLLAEIAAQGDAPEWDLTGWVFTLIEVVVMDTDEEFAARRCSSAVAATNAALEEVAKASPFRKGATLASSGAAEDDVATVTEFQPGCAVWAQWPGDGRWYRARISSNMREEWELEWLQPPEDVECGRDLEYLGTAIGGYETVWTRLPSTCLVPGSRPRPSPSMSRDQATWPELLDTAESLSRSFVSLRTACADSVTPSPDIRMCAAAKQRLLATVQALAARREKLAALAADAAVASRKPVIREAWCKDEVVPASSSPTSPAPSEATLLDALAARVGRLDEARGQLLSRLASVEGDLAAAREELRSAQACSSADAPEPSAPSLSGLLAEAVEVSRKVEALLASREEKVEVLEAALSSSTPASAPGPAASQATAAAATAGASPTEALAAASSCPSPPELPGREAVLRRACLESELLRRRQLEELLAGVHAAVWGPHGEALVRDAPRLAAVRGLIARTGSLVEQSWREMVQLAAETLGGDADAASGANSEDSSRAAKRYKEMRSELQANIERLAALEQCPHARNIGREFEVDHIG